jgi:WD40 repeat protein
MLWDPVLRFFFGRDIFISYSRRDSDHYAVALVNALKAEKHGPACYLDKWAAPPDVDLPASLQRHLRWSGMLVLIATPHATASPSVKKELLLFRRTGRKVLPINIDAALDTIDWSAEPWSGIRGASIEPETAGALEKGTPSESVIHRIRNSVDFTRQEARLQRAVLGTAAGIAILVLLSTLASLAVIQTARTEAARKIADGERTAAQRITAADAKVAAAQVAEKNAQNRAAAALHSASVASAEAARQRDVAHARRLANEADRIRIREPAELSRSVLLAAESVRRMAILGARSIDSDEALRNGVALMPHLMAAVPHDQGVSMIAVNPSNGWIASASGDVATIWDGLVPEQPIARIIHAAEVISLAFDPRGRYLATGSYDNIARITEAATGKELFTVDHSDGVVEVVFNHDGTLVATASEDGLTRISRVPGGELVTNMVADDYPRKMTFSSEGSRLATVDGNGGVRVWESLTGTLVVQPSEEKQEIFAAVSASGRSLVIGDRDGAVMMVDPTTGKTAVPITYPEQFADGENTIFDLAVSSDAKQIATSNGSKLHVWAIENEKGRLVRETDLSDSVGKMTFSSDGRWLATACADSVPHHTLIQVWDVADGDEISRMTVPGENGILEFDASGRHLITAEGKSDTKRSVMRIWDISRNLSLPVISAPLNTAVYSRDGTLIALAGDVAAVRIHETSTGRLITELPYDGKIEALAFSPDGSAVAVAGNRKIVIWTDWRKHPSKSDVTIEKQILGVNGLAFSPRGTYLAAAYTSTDVYIWKNWQTAPVEIAHLEHPAAVHTVSFSGDEVWVAVSCEDDAEFAERQGRPFANGAWVWRLDGKKHVATIHQEDAVYQVAVSRDGQYLATGGGNTTRVWRQWNSTRPEEVARLRHTGFVGFVSFSDDSHYLMTGSVDQTARIWSLPTGEELARFSHAGWVEAVAFSPDQKRVLTASNDGTARAWLWSPDVMIREACSRLTRNLTAEEWVRYQGREPRRKTCDALPLDTDRVGARSIEKSIDELMNERQPHWDEVPEVAAHQLTRIADLFLKKFHDTLEFRAAFEETFVSSLTIRRRLVNFVCSQVGGPALLSSIDQTLRDELFMAISNAGVLESAFEEPYPPDIKAAIAAIQDLEIDGDSISPAYVRQVIAHMDAFASVCRLHIRRSGSTSAKSELSKAVVRKGWPELAIPQTTAVYSVQRANLVFHIIREGQQWRILLIAPPDRMASAASVRPAGSWSSPRAHATQALSGRGH